ncbi:MAG: hypothetical protein AAGN64_13180 [Bacteroidota bacterium]
MPDARAAYVYFDAACDVENVRTVMQAVYDEVYPGETFAIKKITPVKKALNILKRNHIFDTWSVVSLRDSWGKYWVSTSPATPMETQVLDRHGTHVYINELLPDYYEERATSMSFIFFSDEEERLIVEAYSYDGGIELDYVIAMMMVVQTVAGALPLRALALDAQIFLPVWHALELEPRFDICLWPQGPPHPAWPFINL